jgi:hypothetical protein
VSPGGAATSAPSGSVRVPVIRVSSFHRAAPAWRQAPGTPHATGAESLECAPGRCVGNLWSRNLTSRNAANAPSPPARLTSRETRQPWPRIPPGITKFGSLSRTNAEDPVHPAFAASQWVPASPSTTSVSAGLTQTPQAFRSYDPVPASLAVPNQLRLPQVASFRQRGHAGDATVRRSWLAP